MTKADSIIGLIVLVVVLVVVVLTPNNWPPCPTEDSSQCYWDGGKNGEGTRFIAITDTIIIRL